MIEIILGGIRILMHTRFIQFMAEAVHATVTTLNLPRLPVAFGLTVEQVRAFVTYISCLVR